MAVAPAIAVQFRLPACSSRYGKLRICARASVRHIDRMNWKSIRLELGSTGEFPAGSVSRAYLVRLPLDDQDKLDEDALRLSPAKATVRRHWSTDPDERGFVVRADGHWSLRCEGKDRLLEIESHAIRLGGRIAMVEPNGDVLPLKIASVR
jgi:hypothetical protein